MPKCLGFETLCKLKFLRSMEEALLYTRLLHIQLISFGEIVQSVGVFIASRGPQTLSSLIQGLGVLITTKKIKEALLVLICQRFVTISSQSKIDITGSCFYVVSRQGIIEHLLYPIIIAESESIPGLSQEAVSLFIQILVNGNSIKIDDYLTHKQHFENLVIAGILTDGLEKTPLISTQLSTSGHMEKKNSHSASNNEYSMIFSQLSQQSVHSNTTPTNTETVPKRLKPTLAPILYVNWELFQFRLKTRWMIDFYSARVHLSAGFLMKLILDQIEENNLCIATTRISLFNILQRLPPDAPSFNVTSTNNSRFSDSFNENSLGFGDSFKGNLAGNATIYLQLMIDASLGMIFRSKDETEFSIGINPDAIQSVYRSLLIEQYVLDKFGDNSLRIYRLLAIKQLLEEKQISKLTMVSLKEVREKLFQLHKNGLISIQEVPRTPDHAPSRTIFLWKHIPCANTIFIRCLHIIVNCLERANYEKLSNPNNSDSLEAYSLSIVASMVPCLFFS